MGEIRYGSFLELATGGPQALGPTGSMQAVHLRQGSMDGACGPYSLFMALLCCGVVDREDVTALQFVHRGTRLGRLLAALEAHPALFRDGTSLVELEELVANSFGRVVDFEVCLDKGTRVRDFVVEFVLTRGPVILGLWYPRGGHWVVAVGVQFDDEGAPEHLLILDPDASAPELAVWNGMVRLIPQPGPWPYAWKEGFVRLEYALALQPR